MNEKAIIRKFLEFYIQWIIPKKQVQSVPIAALCLYNIQRENLVFKNSLCMYDKINRLVVSIAFYVVAGAEKISFKPLNK